MAEEGKIRGSSTSFPERLSREFFAVVALLALFILALFLATPFILERVMTGYLERLGVESPEVTVRSVTPRAIHLEGIVIQGGRLSVDSLSVYYSPSGLLRGRLDRIVVHRFNWHITFRDGMVDLGLPGLAGNDSSPPTAPPIPFTYLEVSSSSVTVDYDGISIPIPFDVTLDASHAPYLELTGVCRPLGIPIVIGGEGDIEAGTARIEAGVSNVISDRLPLSGSFDLYAGWRRDAGDAGWGNLALFGEATHLVLDLAGFRVRLDEALLSAHTSLADAAASLAGGLQIAGLEYDEYLLDHLSLSIGEGGGISEFSMRLEKPLAAALTLSGNHSTIPKMLAPGGGFEGSFRWTVDMDVPGELVSSQSRGMVDAGNDLTVHARGRLETGIPGRPDWSLEAEVSNIRVDPLSFKLTEERLEVTGLAFQGKGTISADARGIRGSLGEGSRVSAGPINLEDDDMPVRLGSMEILAPPGRPLLVFSADDEGNRRLFFDGILKDSLRATLQDLRFSAGSLGARAEVLFDRSGLRHWSALVDLDKGDLLLPDPPIRLEGIALRFPAAMGTDLPAEGRFSMDRFSYGELKRSGPGGVISFLDNRLAMEGTWNLLPPSPLELKAHFLIGGRMPQGELRVSRDWAPIPTDEDLLRLAPVIGDLKLSGETRADAIVKITGPTLKPRLEVSLRNTYLSSKDKDMDVQGIAGTVVIDSLDPLTTPENQVFTIDRIRAGMFEAEKGRLAFRVENRDRLFLESMQWRLPMGGLVTLRGSRFDLAEESFRLDLYLEKVDFVALLARLTEGKISGSGLVNGRIPLAYERGRILLDDGYVHALPGEGRLGIRDEEWMNALMHYVNEALSGHAYLEIVADRMEEALRDFIYNYLTVDLSRVGSETGARIEVRGRGARGDPPQEIGSLVLNINDLEELLNRAVGFAVTREESIERALEELLDF